MTISKEVMSEYLKGILRYLKYIIKHKYLVGKMCFKVGLYRQGITHDLSKLSPKEFTAYMKYYSMGDKTQESKDNFDKGRLHHIHHNPHHRQYRVLVDENIKEGDKQVKALEMPDKYWKEMLCDWQGTGKGFSKELWKYKYCEWFETYARYYKNKEQIILHDGTRTNVERFLKTRKRETREDSGASGWYGQFEQIYSE